MNHRTGHATSREELVAELVRERFGTPRAAERGRMLWYLRSEPLRPYSELEQARHRRDLCRALHGDPDAIGDTTPS